MFTLRLWSHQVYRYGRCAYEKKLCTQSLGSSFKVHTETRVGAQAELSVGWSRLRRKAALLRYLSSYRGPWSSPSTRCQPREGRPGAQLPLNNDRTSQKALGMPGGGVAIARVEPGAPRGIEADIRVGKLATHRPPGSYNPYCVLSQIIAID